MKEKQKDKTNDDQKGVGYYFDFGEVLTYFFKKKHRSKPANLNIRMMHGINRIAIIIFLIGILIIIAKRLL